MKLNIVFLSVYLALPWCYSEKGDVVGCFRFEVEFINTHTGGSVEICTSACEGIFYRYALLSNGSYCYCGNTPGKSPTDESLCKMPCPRNSTQMCGGDNVSNVYDTGVTVSGPPSNIKITNLTQTNIHVWWKQPDAHTRITGYKIRSEAISTYSDNVLKPLEWFFSNNTFHTELLNLHPGTLYNLTISALSAEGSGIATHAEVETEIGDPDPSPPQVIIKERDGDRMVIRIPEASNVNGPVSKYRIVVINGDLQQGFLVEYLKSFREAAEEGIPYYITAELDPPDIKHDFIVGDKRYYNKFYNAPLPQSKNIQISLGIVSYKKGITKVRYTHLSDVMVLNVNEEEQTSGFMMFLGGAVAIGVVLLIIGVGVLIVLRQRVGLNRRQRLSQSMPLSGPCIEIENTGFIPDEDERVDHYGNLKRQLWNIPRNFLEVDNGSIVGMGSFGQFVRGRVQHHGAHKPALVQAIADSELLKTDRKVMLGELDLLIKSSGHDNVVSLIGICEIPETLYVVLEDTRHTLKELLLSSRHRDSQNGKFCLINESKILQISVDIAKGMQYLTSKKILHKRLSCRNVIMADGMTPKISGFGLCHMYTASEKPDYSRWTAQEMFRQNNFSVKSDVWSFGCLLWELLSLGGTLYHHVPSKDVPNRVMRGMRPAQLPYIGDELYQISLHCWQLDLDERPSFSDIVATLEALLSQNTSGMLSFVYYNGFQYETYNLELELLN